MRKYIRGSIPTNLEKFSQTVQKIVQHGTVSPSQFHWNVLFWFGLVGLAGSVWFGLVVIASTPPKGLLRFGRGVT